MIPPDSQNTPPTAQTGQDEDTGSNEWLARARSAFRSSTSYVDGNWRKAWEDSIRAFNNMHPSDSKYNAPAYEKRSRLYVQRFAPSFVRMKLPQPPRSSAIWM
jgi:hypothetical protein